ALARAVLRPAVVNATFALLADKPARWTLGSRPASARLAIGRLCALSAVLLSAGVLASWLARPWIGHPESSLWLMKANTAFTTLCVSLAMLLLPSRSPRLVRARRALATLAGAVSLATLAEYAAGVDLGIDQLLASDAGPSFPGRMSPWSGAALVCLATGALAHGSRRLDAVADAALVAAAVILQLIVAGYLYDVAALYGVDPSIRVSGQTLLAMSALWVALVAGRVGNGVFEIATRPTVGGTAARWLLPVALVLPPLVGGVRLVAQRKGWIASVETGVALFAVAQTLTIAAVVYAFARHLDVVERRYAAERQRRGELERLVAVCAWTGRVQWKGEWVRIERFLKERFGLGVTHSISEEAFEAMERELDQWTPPDGAG
ncbi:MAG TPA: hypothetical protein VNE71_07835, partial [Myxococcota bacterium]|nr:hypothetical protein [Myxococcota bacterium]